MRLHALLLNRPARHVSLGIDLPRNPYDELCFFSTRHSERSNFRHY